MLPLKSLITINRKSETAVYLQLANQLIALIREGVLRPGSTMPSIRELSRLMNVHPRTIVAAYDEMVVQDWITTVPKKGVFVSSKLPQINPQSYGNSKLKRKKNIPKHAGRNEADNKVMRIKKSGEHRLIINDGFPDPRIAPVDLLMREYKKLYHNPAIQRKSMFGEIAGAYNLRVALSRFLSETRGLHSKAENIFITRGAQMALYLVARTILKPGSIVIVGEPNYPKANYLFEKCGAKLIRIPVDEEGLDIGHVERICKTKKPDLLYIVPHHHHPTTVTLSAERRMRLLTLIQHHNFCVIEDDYDYDFHYNSSPILPLASYDHLGNVIYVGSISKSFTSALKVGYLVASPDFIERIGQLRDVIDIRGDNFMEEALAMLFRNGDMSRHLKKSLKLYRERRDYFYEALNAGMGDVIEFNKPHGGMAFWVRFNKQNKLSAIAKMASDLGLYMSNGMFYNTGKKEHNALRVGFASFNFKEIDEVVSILQKVTFRGS